MDVDFSQVGQNVAATFSGQNNVRPVSPDEQASSQQKSVENERKNSQVSAQTVDKTEELNSGSQTIEGAVAEISEFVQAQNRQLQFSIDEDSKRSVVKVTDAESGEIIRQIPSEEVLALSERIKELQTDVGAAVGVLFSKQV